MFGILIFKITFVQSITLFEDFECKIPDEIKEIKIILFGLKMNNTLKVNFFARLSLMLFMFVCSSTHVVAQTTVIEIVPEKQKNEISDKLKWSERMALTLMNRHPQSYMIDDAKNPHWDYVHGLVLYAFEELNKQKKNERYAAYPLI